MNRQRVTPPAGRGPDGLKSEEPRTQCEALDYNRYENMGYGGERQCERLAVLGGKYCLRHRKREALDRAGAAR